MALQLKLHSLEKKIRTQLSQQHVGAYGSIWETRLRCRPVEQCPVRFSGGCGQEGVDQEGKGWVMLERCCHAPPHVACMAA